MTTQSEQSLENNLIQQLVGLGYEQVDVTDDKQLVENFRDLVPYVDGETRTVQLLDGLYFNV